MPKKRPRKPRNFSLPPTLALKALALRDDPLVHEHSRIHDQLFSSGLPSLGQPSGQALRLRSKLETLAKKISKTYNITLPNGSYPRFGLQKDWVALLAQRFYIHNILRISTSWRSSFSPAPSVNALAKRLSQLPTLPDKPTKDSPPTVILKLDLSQVKRNNLAPLVKEFKSAIRRCLDEVPKPLRKPPSMLSENIDRDYTRFRLHREGMPFRWIAYQERTGREPSCPITGPVPTESSVRESVGRVHMILFAKQYSARQHKSSLREAPLMQAFDRFSCPLHGHDDCPLTCKHARSLMEKTKRLLK
jgi:hypothetical protein